MRVQIIVEKLRKFKRALNPANEAARLATLALHGTMPIEEMLAAKVARGRLSPLFKVVADILMDLKQQRAERAALEQEIRDRIANRTDALERKIGSLQVQAARDPLTGLGNRRALDNDLSQTVSKFKSGAVDACLLMIDIDNFKPLNDTLGHPAGDQLLKEIGQLIRSTLRGNDQAYRSGGDEFVVILNDCNAAAGQAIAIRLESLVRVLTKPLKVAFPPQLSIGTCALSELTDATAQLLMQTADGRLYEVKANKPRVRRSA